MIRVIGPSALAAAVLWYLLWRYLPTPASLTPFGTALGCCAVAALMTLVTGVEAIAHERLFTAAIDPLAGFTNRRLQVNFRYLSNTVEQFIVFAAGLLALTPYANARTLVIVTIVWILARWAFWIGYHRNSLLRGLGAPGMIQSLAVLLYVTYRFGTDSFGPAAGLALLILFGAIEALLFWAPTRRAQ